jgi:hypothetical protein
VASLFDPLDVPSQYYDPRRKGFVSIRGSMSPQYRGQIEEGFWESPFGKILGSGLRFLLSDRGISAIQGRNDPYTGEAFELRPEDQVELTASFFPQSVITGGLSKAGGLLAIAALKPPKDFSRWIDFFKKNPAQRGDYNTYESAEIRTQIVRELKEENPDAILSKKEGGLGGAAGIVKYLRDLIGEGGENAGVKRVWDGGNFLPAVTRGPLSTDQIKEVIDLRRTLKVSGKPIGYRELAKRFGVDSKTIGSILQQDFVNDFYVKNNLGVPPNMAHFNLNKALTPREVVDLLRAGKPNQKVNKYADLTLDEYLRLSKDDQGVLRGYARNIKNPSDASLSSQKNRLKKYIDDFAGEDADRLKGIGGERTASLPIFNIINNPDVRKLFPKAFNEIASGDNPILFKKASDATEENINVLNRAIVKHYSPTFKPKNKYNYAKNSLAFHKAREFATQGAGWKEDGSPSSSALKMGFEWVNNLTPAKFAEFEALWDHQQRMNRLLRDPQGRVNKSFQRTLHHPQWLSKGGETSYRQDYNWELLPKWKHDQVHADKILSDRKKRDEMIKKFKLRNLIEDPEYVMKSFEGTIWD